LISGIVHQLHKERSKLNAELRRIIDAQLGATYGALMTEPVPNRHLDILQHFEMTEQAPMSSVIKWEV